jgi:hypothetical protein
MDAEGKPSGRIVYLLFLLIGGIKGLVLVWHTRKRGERRIVYGFYAIFSISLLFTAMEEVAWGQWFFGFETHSFLKESVSGIS